MVDSTPQDIGEIFDRAATELAHARALEDGIKYHEQLDGQLNSAIKRFHVHFMQLQQYREVYQRTRAEEFVDAWMEEGASNPPIIPALEGTGQ